MPLDVEQITTMAFALGMPEVVEAGSEHVCHRLERSDVPAQVAAVGWVQPVRLYHHRHRIPAHVGTQTAFDFQVAGAARLLFGLQSVDVTCGGRKRQVNAVLPGMFEQLLE